MGFFLEHERKAKIHDTWLKLICNCLTAISIELFVFAVREELRIEEYSFSQTTLEQVFLKFAHVQEEDDSDNDSERGGVKM